MAVLAHLTSFDSPTLFVAFVAGLAAGLTLAWFFGGDPSQDGDH